MERSMNLNAIIYTFRTYEDHQTDMVEIYDRQERALITVDEHISKMYETLDHYLFTEDKNILLCYYSHIDPILEEGRLARRYILNYLRDEYPIWLVQNYPEYLI